MKIKLRYILIILLIFLLVGSLVYKYKERLLLIELVNNYNGKLVQELTQIEQSGETSKEAGDLFVEILTNEDLSNDEYFQKLQELQGKTRLVINGDEDYIQTLTKNKVTFEGLRNKAKFFIGKRGKFEKDFIDKQIKYYENEIESAQRNLSRDYLILNIFSVMRDRAIIEIFQDKTVSNPERDIPYYYSEISVLEKYTGSDFAFKDEKNIKKLYSYGYETLHRNKEYMKSYYSVAKDFVAGNYESAVYKYSRLSDAELSLNIDFERLSDEGTSEDIELAKKILEVSFSKINDIKQFKESLLGVYPLFDEVGGWKEDLEMCQLYQYKFSMVNAITKSYPEASTFEELIKELSKVAPKSDVLDNRFNKGVIQFSSNEEEARFICRDSENNREFVFVIEKL